MKTKIILFAMLVMLALCSVQAFINPIALVRNIITVNRVRQEFPDAKARWQASGIKSYNVDVEGFIPLLCLIDARLQVRDGKLASVLARNPFDENAPYMPVESDRWDSVLDNVLDCPYSKIILDEKMIEVERYLDIDVWENALDVQFDPQYGFISFVEFRAGYRTGSISECCSWMRYSNFQPMGE